MRWLAGGRKPWTLRDHAQVESSGVDRGFCEDRVTNSAGEVGIFRELWVSDFAESGAHKSHTGVRLLAFGSSGFGYLGHNLA